MDMDERAKNLEMFRNSTSFAVTTDLLGRELDVPAVKIVINFDLPENTQIGEADTKAYKLRAGRTSRFGKLIAQGAYIQYADIIS